MQSDHLPTKKDLRNFGFLVGGILTVIGLWPLVFRGEPVRAWAIGIGGLLIVLGAAWPLVLTRVYHGWMWVGLALGWINTRILLGIVFYGLITPIGFVLRLMGKDAMRRAFSESSETYRVMRSPRSHSHMKHQF